MIIWIASYPKSGNTWIRSLLSAYLYTNDGIFDFSLLNHILKFPSKKYLKYFIKDFSDMKKISEYWIAAQDRINLYNNKISFLKTHSSLCKIENNSFTDKKNTQAVIYIVRDPRNVITSISNHYSMTTDQAFNFISNNKQIITEDHLGGKNFGIGTVLGSWPQHYKSWKNINFAPILILKYEDLITDINKSLVNILKFLQKFMNIEIEKNKINNTINTCNFENLRKMEKEKGFSESVFSPKSNKKVIFFNLGKKNNWKNLLKPELTKKIKRQFNIEMEELGYN